MERPKRGLRSAGSIVAKIPEFIVHRQSDPGAVCCLLKDHEIAVQACPIGDRTTALNRSQPGGADL
jgi:hypothetical protein